METTLNIRIDIYEKIMMTARLKGVSCSEIIIVLIKKMMDEISDPGRMGRLIQYQERCMPADWHTFHLSAREDEYEYLLDLRKLLKMSVSLILACAVDKFLDKIRKGKITDNNRYRNYIIIKEAIDEIICWRFIWGFPPNLRKFLTFSSP